MLGQNKKRELTQPTAHSFAPFEEEFMLHYEETPERRLAEVEGHEWEISRRSRRGAMRPESYEYHDEKSAIVDLERSGYTVLDPEQVPSFIVFTWTVRGALVGAVLNILLTTLCHHPPVRAAYAGGGTRTHTPRRAADFKSAASTVPPPRRLPASPTYEGPACTASRAATAPGAHARRSARSARAICAQVPSSRRTD